MVRRSILVVFFVGAACGIAAKRAAADLVSDDSKYVRAFAILDLGSFDDYCEHRREIVAGDTLEKIALGAYGDRARVADLRKANPDVVPEKLPVGSQLLLPPKLAAPAGSKETLAWRFYAGSNYSPPSPLARVWPKERFASPGKACVLVAVPEAKAAEFEQLLDARGGARGGQAPVDVLLREAPDAVVAKDFHLNERVSPRSKAIASTTTLRVASLLAAAGSTKGLFQLSEQSVVYVDAGGQRVELGLGSFLESSPLVAIALLGLSGLMYLRRRFQAARPS